MSRLNLKFKIFTEILVRNYGRINHLSMSRPYLKFKIVSEILVSNYGGSIILSCPG